MWWHRAHRAAPAWCCAVLAGRACAGPRPHPASLGAAPRGGGTLTSWGCEGQKRHSLQQQAVSRPGEGQGKRRPGQHTRMDAGGAQGSGGLVEASEQRCVSLSLQQHLGTDQFCGF